MRLAGRGGRAGLWIRQRQCADDRDDRNSTGTGGLTAYQTLDEHCCRSRTGQTLRAAEETVSEPRRSAVLCSLTHSHSQEQSSKFEEMLRASFVRPSPAT